MGMLSSTHTPTFRRTIGREAPLPATRRSRDRGIAHSSEPGGDDPGPEPFPVSVWVTDQRGDR